MAIDKYASALIAFAICIPIFVMVTTTANFLFDFQGDPSNWERWNGYKAGGTFILSNQDGEFGRIDESSVGIENDCTPNIPGFEGGDAFLNFESEIKTSCSDLDSGTNVTVYSETERDEYTIRVDGEGQ